MPDPAPVALTAPAALFRRAIALLRAKDAAGSALLPELERFAGYGPGWLALGEFLAEAGHDAAAMAALRRAAAAIPPDPAAWRALGQCCARQQDRPAALAAFAQAVAVDPAYAEGWFSLGLAHQDADDPQQAATCYETALRLRPHLHEAALNLGIARQDSGDLEGAMDAYAIALEHHAGCFGRVAQALTSGRKGALWLEPARLRAALIARRENACGSDPAR